MAGYKDQRRYSAIQPVLSLRDPRAGISMLAQVFGFECATIGNDKQITMELGDQSLIVGNRGPFVGSARPHHLALSVPDVDAAMADVIARGGRLATSMTPDGPLEIPEFWADGVRYVFFEGPEGVLIELCMKLGSQIPSKWGHDHIGIECRRIEESKADFIRAGCTVIAEHGLVRDGGITRVCFLEKEETIIEVFSPPSENDSGWEKPEYGWVGCVI